MVTSSGRFGRKFDIVVGRILAPVSCPVYHFIPLSTVANFWQIFVLLFRVRVDTSINTVNKAVTTIPIDKVNDHFSHRIIINYDF